LFLEAIALPPFGEIESRLEHDSSFFEFSEARAAAPSKS